MTLHISAIRCYFLLCIVFLLTSCKKFIEIDPPQTQLGSQSVFEEKYTAISAVTGIYGDMSSMYVFNILTGLSADEFTSYGVDIYLNLYTNSLTEKDGASLFWGKIYNYIYQANAAIIGLQQSKGLTSDVKNQLLGEVKFIRAFWYFYLINLYGDAPLVTTTDYNIILKQPRSPKAAIYNQIISDLKDARILLGNDYVDNKNKPTKDRVRPTKWVATALLSRVYLFAKDYRNAETESSTLIDNKNTFILCQDLNEVFLKNSSEAIWQLIPQTGYYQTEEGSNFILTSTPNYVAISPQQLKAFEPDDNRLKKWIDSIVVSGITYYYPFKYKVKYGSGEATEYSMVFRLAEQFLIRSEARAQLNNLTAAAADLDSIRIRAGLPPTSASTQHDLLNAILKERQVELFSEGHRWLDLKAAGKIDEVMTKVTPAKGGGKWESFQQLYPIPKNDIQFSTNLKQNPGY